VTGTESGLSALRFCGKNNAVNAATHQLVE
jgi:hypothetical protein